MSRPKSSNKMRLNLTIDKDAVTGARKVAVAKKRSLSDMTEELYVKLHKSFFGLQKNLPEQLKAMQEQLDSIKSEYNNKKLKEEENKG
jgi:hypothetical protein